MYFVIGMLTLLRFSCNYHTDRFCIAFYCFVFIEWYLKCTVFDHASCDH